MLALLLKDSVIRKMKNILPKERKEGNADFKKTIIGVFFDF